MLPQSQINWLHKSDLEKTAMLSAARKEQETTNQILKHITDLLEKRGTKKLTKVNVFSHMHKADVYAR